MYSRHLYLGLLWVVGFSTQAQMPLDTLALAARTLPEVVIRTEREPATEALILPEVALAHSLETLTGINLISRGGYGQEPVYRAQAPQRMQVQIDGMRVFSAGPARMDPAISYLDEGALQSAQLHSNSHSQAHHSGLSGSLDLELGHPTLGAPSFSGQLFSAYHSNTQGTDQRGAFTYQNEKWAIKATGAYQNHQNYRAGNGAIIQPSHYQRSNIALLSTVKLSDHELLKAHLIADQLGFAGFPAVPMDASDSHGFIGGVEYGNYRGWGPFRQIEAQLYHNNLYHHMDDAERTDVFMHMDMPSWSHTTGGSLSAKDWRLGAHRLDVALEAYSNFRRAEMTMFAPSDQEPDMFMLPWPDSRLSGIGIGFTHQRQGQRWHWQNTLRLDWQSTRVLSSRGSKTWGGFGFEVDRARHFLNPQLRSRLSFQHRENQEFFAGISLGQRSGSTSELYGYYLFNAHDAFDYLGNPLLKPEQLLNMEVGYRIGSPRWSLCAEAFTLQYRNYIFGELTDIDNMTIRARGVRTYVNAARASFWGTELRGHYQWSNHWQSTAQMAYMRGFLPGRFDLPLIPPLQGSLGTQYQKGAWQAGLQSQWAAAQPHYNAELGDRYTPSYGLLHSEVHYTLSGKKWRWKLGLQVQNILNQKYRPHLNWGGIPSPGRNLIFSLNIRPQEKKRGAHPPQTCE